MAAIITLKWFPRFNATEYRVYRSTAPFDENSLPAVLATLPGSALEFVDDPVTRGVKYYYCIAADNAQTPAQTAFQFVEVNSVGVGQWFFYPIEITGADVYAIEGLQISVVQTIVEADLYVIEGLQVSVNQSIIEADVYVIEGV